MRDDDKLTVNQNFRVSPTLQKAIEDDAAELDLSTSAYLRACVYLAGPLLLRYPHLTLLNRRILHELAASICKTLVIRPACVTVAGAGEPEGGESGAENDTRQA